LKRQERIETLVNENSILKGALDEKSAENSYLKSNLEAISA